MAIEGTSNNNYNNEKNKFKELTKYRVTTEVLT